MVDNARRTKAYEKCIVLRPIGYRQERTILGTRYPIRWSYFRWHGAGVISQRRTLKIKRRCPSFYAHGATTSLGKVVDVCPNTLQGFGATLMLSSADGTLMNT